MLKRPLPIPLGFYTSQSTPISSQNCINWLPTVMQAVALNNVALIQRSGLTQFADTSNGACRGGMTVNGLAYFVCGTSLFSISSAGVATNRGAISGTNRVSMANNGTSLVIVVPSGNGYVYDVSTSTLTKISDVDYQTSDTVTFYRGYFVFTASDGKQLFVSNLNQPLTFDALDYGSADGDPDRIVTQILDHDELSVIGEHTTEMFKSVGGVDFPLQIIPGAYTEKGAASKYGAIKFDNSYLFIGGGKNEKASVWRQTSSANASKISTDAIDNEIQKFTDDEIAEAFMMNYSKKGQTIALITLNSTRIPSRTFGYNATAAALSQSPVWFEFQSGVDANSWRANTIISAYGKLLVGDATNGKIGYLNDDDYTDYNEPMLRQATTSPFSENSTTIFAGEFEATFQSGVGLTVGQGSTPIVRMRFTDDGGRTFSSSFSRTIGKIGRYGQRSIWRRQGSLPVARSIRLTITDPVLANLIELSATPELGTS